MTNGPTVVVACTFPAAGLDLLRRRFDVEIGGNRPAATWLRDHVPGSAALVTDPIIRVDRELLDAAGSSLKVVSNFGVGYDNIDIDAVRMRGVRATDTPNVLTNATAELAVALMLAAGRRIAEADAMIRRGQWSGSEEEILGRELAGATVGLVGFGRIARRVAELLRWFEVRLLCASRSGAPSPAGVKRCELHDLLATSDFVSSTCPSRRRPGT